MRYLGLLTFFLYSTTVFAQQTLTPTQQRDNYKHELVLSDITLQELRARTGNIMRQAYELETQVQQLQSENKQLQETIEKLKEQISDVEKTNK